MGRQTVQKNVHRWRQKVNLTMFINLQKLKLAQNLNKESWDKESATWRLLPAIFDSLIQYCVCVDCFWQYGKKMLSYYCLSKKKIQKRLVGFPDLGRELSTLLLMRPFVCVISFSHGLDSQTQLKTQLCR